MLLAIAGARVDSFQGEPRCTAWVDRCTLDPYVPEASATLKAWWAARVGDDPPPLISSVSRCIPLAEVATACAKGAPTVDVLAVVCGDVADKTFATGEVAHVTTLCDYDASALLYVLRGGDGTASASYGDGAVLHVAGAELGQAADGRYTLVATAANVRAFPSADKAATLYQWYASGKRPPASGGSASLSIPADDPPRAAVANEGPGLGERASSFCGQFGWEPPAFGWGAPEPMMAGAGAEDEEDHPAAPLLASNGDGRGEEALYASSGDEWLCESSGDEAQPDPKRSFVSWRPLPVQPADACVLRERRDRCFEACEQAFNQRFGRQCADEAVAQAEQLGALAPVDDPDALLDAVLPHLTNDGVEPFLRAFLASPPRVGRKRTRSHWDCGESDGAPEAMCSAAGQDAGGGGFVDLEAGRSSGSEAGDEDEDDDEAGSLDGFVVEDEVASSSDYETEEEEEPIAHGRLRRGSDSVEREAAEALLGRSLDGLSIVRLEAPRARDVVAGAKTLELTEGPCNKRGPTLIGETATGADAKSCVIGAVTLGECRPMSRDEFEAAKSRHLAHDFAPAQAWLDSGSLHATELHDAVRFETPVPYQQKKGARKWLGYQPPVTLLTEQRRDMLERLDVVHRRIKRWRQRIKRCQSVSTLQQTEEPLQRLETALQAVHDGGSSEEGGGEDTTQADEYDALSSSEACSEAGTAARKHAADAYLLALPEERCVAEEAAGGIFVDPITKERNLLMSPYTEAEKAARRRAAVDEEGEEAVAEEEEEGEGAAGMEAEAG